MAILSRINDCIRINVHRIMISHIFLAINAILHSAVQTLFVEKHFTIEHTGYVVGQLCVLRRSSIDRKFPKTFGDAQITNLSFFLFARKLC